MCIKSLIIKRYHLIEGANCTLKHHLSHSAFFTFAANYLIIYCQDGGDATNKPVHESELGQSH